MNRTEQTERMCGALIPLILKRQAELKDDTGQDFLLTVDVPAVTVLAMLPVYVAAIENLRDDILPEAYGASNEIVETLLSHIIDGYGGESAAAQFEIVATLREAGVDISHVVVDGERIDIPPTEDA